MTTHTTENKNNKEKIETTMRRTTKLTPFSCLGQQGFRGAWQRLSMTLMLMMLTTMTAWATTEAVETYYIDENGTQQNVTATVLTGGGSTTLAAGTYVVNSDIEYTGKITLGGDVNIILGDGKTMTVTNTGTNYYDYAIYGESKALHIYGQSQGTGALTATAVAEPTIYINANNGAGSLLGIHGGVVTVNNSGIYVEGNNANSTGGIIISDGLVTISGAITCEYGHFNILGGQVTVNGTVGLLADLTLGCSKDTDFISFNEIVNTNLSSDEVAGEVKIATGTTLYDGTGAGYDERTASSTLAALTNVTLRTYDFRPVTFDSNGGSAVAAQILIPGGKATEPTAPTREGCTFNGWKLNGADYNFDSNVNSPITLLAQWSATTTYVDENGTPTDNVAAIALGGAETTLSAGTYLVNSDITYDHTLKLGNGTVNIILADGKTMNINVVLEDIGITKDDGDGVSPDLHIYGQTTDTNDAGSMEVSSTNGIIDINSFTQHSGNVKSVATAGDVSVYAFNVSNFTLNGGKLTVSAIWTNANGIYANDNVTINGGVLNATATSATQGEAAIFGKSDVIINGGQVSVTAPNGCVGIKSSEGDITLGYNSADDFVQASSYVVSSGKEVKIKAGLKMTDGENTYNDQTESATLAGLTNVKLFPVTHTVTFSITNGDESPAAQTVAHNMKATAPVLKGYHVNTWNLGDVAYDFNTPVTTDITLTAERTPITYTVQFDNNGGSGTMAAVVATYDQWTSIPNCTFTAPEGYALKEYGWNTAADGSGDSFYAESGDFRNLASEQDAVVTLYAQWGKDIKLCTAEEVPDQTMNGYDYIWYKFEAANYGNASTGVKITDGNKVLTLGTDYKFKDVIYKNARQDNETMPHEVGDKCTLIIQGIGEYAGTKEEDFTIVSPVYNGTWGDLAWNINSNGDFTISLKDGVTGPVAMQETTQGNYDWYSKANSIRTITIGDGITSVAANAFAGTANVNSYGNVYSLDLPESLTTIGENAFAYCTGLSIDLANLDRIDYPASAFSYIGTITGTLYDKADNSKVIEMMANARTTNVTIKGRTLYKDGNWNTICLPFNVSKYNSLLDGATVKELDLFGYYSEEGVYYSYAAANLRRTGFDAENGTLYLFFKDATADSNDNLLKAGTPYLIKWPSGGTDITSDLTFEGVKVIASPQTFKSEDKNVSFNGTFTPTAIAVNDKSCLFLGVGKNAQNQDVSTLYWPAGSNYTSFPDLDPAAADSHYYLGAFRAWFHIDLNGGTNAVRSFNLNFGDEEETTGIISTTNYTNSAGAGWYDLSGRKLQGMPTAKGIYVHNGHKVVIK